VCLDLICRLISIQKKQEEEAAAERAKQQAEEQPKPFQKLSFDQITKGNYNRYRFL